MRSLSFTTAIFTLTFFPSSGCALPHVDQPLSTQDSIDTYERPSAIDTDISVTNQISIPNHPEEPLPAILLVRSLPYSHNITLPVSTCLDVIENPDLTIVANHICPGDQKPYTIIFKNPKCMVTNPFTRVLPRIELTNDQPFWDQLKLPVVPSKSFTVPEKWSLMLKCAISPREAFSSLAEPYGRQILAPHRIRYFVFSVLDTNDAVFMLNGSMPGTRTPQVNQIPESTCLWSSSREAASRIRMLRTPECPSGKEPYLLLYTQRECRGEYTISDWPGPETRLFEDAGVGEWSLLFSCSRKGEEHVMTGPVEELRIGGERYTIANATQPLDTDEIPEILPSQENATLALTSTLTPQIFQIPLLTCLTSSSSSSSSSTSSYNVSSLLRIVSPPICPPNQTSHTALYAEEDCNSIRRMMIGPKSYPLYRPFFSFAPWLKTWSLGFVCIPDAATLSFPAKWEKSMELVVERKKGMGPVIPGQGRDIVGTTVQLVSRS